jgi:hypothetical protein
MVRKLNEKASLYEGHGFSRAVNRCAEHCSTAWRCKSSSHPDGGEVIAKRKGVVARRGLKEAWSKDASRWTR